MSTHNDAVGSAAGTERRVDFALLFRTLVAGGASVHVPRRGGGGGRHAHRVGLRGSDGRASDRPANEGRDRRRVGGTPGGGCAPPALDVGVDAEAMGLIDTCGTGGRRQRFAEHLDHGRAGGGGAPAPRVCKHGNRAVSSSCGSADLLEALGIVVDLGPTGVAGCLEQAGIAFCLAPLFHPALRHAGPTRRSLGVPTAFNYLGPMANPRRCAAPGDRRERSCYGRAHGRGSGGHRHAACHGRPRLPRTRRVLHGRANAGHRTCGRAGSSATRSRRKILACPRLSLPILPGPTWPRGSRQRMRCWPVSLCRGAASCA